MTETLIRIKRCVLKGQCVFSDKALAEMEEDHLSEEDVFESIINAVAIQKTIRSRLAGSAAGMLHVIVGTNFEGIAIYTKGKLVSKGGEDFYYLLVSSKRSL